MTPFTFTVSFSATEYIQTGDTAVLSWTSENAASAFIDNGVGDVPVAGTADVSPADITTYTITVAGPGGTASATATVMVSDPVPAADINATPRAVAPGQPATLAWTTRNADTCVIEPGIGTVALSGSMEVWPTAPTVYTITATGLGMAATAEVRVYAGEATDYAYGDPTPGEQAHIEAVNRTRRDPRAEAARLGIDLCEGIPDCNLGTSVQPLTLNAKLLEAARLHSQDMIDRQYMAHNSPEGVTPEERITNSGYVWDAWGENLGFHGSNAPFDEAAGVLAAHDQLFLDIGVEGRGHRKNILVPYFKEIGVGGRLGPLPGAPYGCAVTCDFASSSEYTGAFMTGVAYDDLDGDGRYTPGEGLPNVEIIVLETGVRTASASAGGYGIPLDPGNHTVRAVFSGGRTVERDVSVSGVNVKLDFVESDAGVPSVVFDADRQIVTAGEPVTLSWLSENAIVAEIDGGVGDVPPDGSIVATPLVTTEYTITVTGIGGTASASVTVWVDETPAPPAPVFTVSAGAVSEGGSAVLSWSAPEGQSVFIDNGIGFVSESGEVTVWPEHTTVYTITAANPGGVGSAKVEVTVLGNPAPLPDKSFGKAYEDLVPPAATIDAYDPDRFSIVTGAVMSETGSPLADVRVGIFGRPEYGTALTDENGRYAIPVEGGAAFTAAFTRDGLITAHRRVVVPWNGIAVADTLVMIEEDTASTEIVFDGNPDNVLVHTGTPTTDEFGTRSCSMVFSGDNTAFMLDENGEDVCELRSLTARATEFKTQDAMPAVLPETSGYTYCAELSADGIGNIRFEKPVVVWVENFLDFAAGTVVPSGYYDRAKGEWIASENGRVVRLLGIGGIVDSLDADGDGLADDLDGDGSYSDEVAGMEGRTVGDEMWRVEVTHFTPWDYNWPYGPPGGAEYPDAKVASVKKCDDECEKSNTMALNEAVPFPGTPLTLDYDSDRVESIPTVIDVGASGATVPSGLDNIKIRYEIAGLVYEREYPPLPETTDRLIWDGNDFRGQPVEQPATAKISVGYTYGAVYYEPSEFEGAFGQSGGEITPNPARQEVTLWDTRTVRINHAEGTIADGWSVSANHQMNPAMPNELLKGDGSVLKRDIPLMETAAGNGDPGYSGDGGPAEFSGLNAPNDVAFDAEGNMYVADTLNHRIRKIDREGIITTVAGTGNPGFSGDGGPAVNAGLNNPIGIAADSRGNLYVADRYNHRVRKIDPDGIITTIAGTGIAEYNGDEIPATAAALNGPADISADDSGNVHIADANNHRVRRVDSDGVIHTLAGMGERNTYDYDPCSPVVDGDGNVTETPGPECRNPALRQTLDTPVTAEADSRGNVWICDLNHNTVRVVESSGNIRIAASIDWPSGIAFDDDGNAYVTSFADHRVYKIAGNGTVTPVAGSGSAGFAGDGGTASASLLDTPANVEVGPDGGIYVADQGNNRIRRIAPDETAQDDQSVDRRRRSANGETVFAEDGIGYVMSETGRHERTVDLETGVILLTFGYDIEDRLVSITDRFGRMTQIHRSGGVPVSIETPDGIVTTLAVDANNQLTRITYPDNTYWEFGYQNNDGLPTSMTQPNGNRTDAVYDPDTKRVETVSDLAGGSVSLSRSFDASGEVTFTETTSENEVTTYTDIRDAAGALLSTATFPTGDVVEYRESADGLSASRNESCGMFYEMTYGLDLEHDYEYLENLTVTSPNGLSLNASVGRVYGAAITETATVNGKTTTSVHDVAASTVTVTSPENRTATLAYDPNTLLTESVSVPELEPTSYTYYNDGRVESVTTGTRVSSYTYDTNGHLRTATDPEQRTTTYEYDIMGRLQWIDSPDTPRIWFDYDENGNTRMITRPTTATNPEDASVARHDFEYNFVNLPEFYDTPLGNRYEYLYDTMGRIDTIRFPSGAVIDHDYANGRLERVTTPEGVIGYEYGCGTNVSAITHSASGEALSFGNDSGLPTSETYSGTLNQTVEFGYNNDFDVETFTYAGVVDTFIYDNDGLPTNAGNYTITRKPSNGLPETVTGNGLSIGRTFNGYGEIDGQSHAVNGLTIASWNVIRRDQTGKILEKSETVTDELGETVTDNYVYAYDSFGRLLTVTKNGTMVEEYAYDELPYGTRTYEMNLQRGINGRTYAYDMEDRLDSISDGTSFTFDADGFLTSKTTAEGTTTYDYSSRGELRSATLPDNTLVEYVHDPIGRRIAKIVNGTIVEKYLWSGRTQLLAVYNGDDSLKMRFEYADGRMPVSMTAEDGQRYFLACDQVGSLRIVANQSGTVVKRIEYDTFGNITDDSDPLFDIPFGFAGGLHDRDTGLVRFGYRDYDPDTGRWTAKDPIGFSGGDTDLFGYCFNDPINRIDPDGEAAIVVAGVILGAGYLVLSNPDIGNTPMSPDDPTDKSYGAEAIMTEGVVGMATVGVISKLGKVIKCGSKSGTTGRIIRKKLDPQMTKGAAYDPLREGGKHLKDIFIDPKQLAGRKDLYKKVYHESAHRWIYNKTLGSKIKIPGKIDEAVSGAYGWVKGNLRYFFGVK